MGEIGNPRFKVLLISLLTYFDFLQYLYLFCLFVSTDYSTVHLTQLLEKAAVIAAECCGSQSFNRNQHKSTLTTQGMFLQGYQR